MISVNNVGWVTEKMQVCHDVAHLCCIFAF